jgi:hypothetical protein
MPADHAGADEPPAWSWEEYEDYLRSEWQRTLNANADDEKAIQGFLEQHPCLLPGGEASSTSIGGHHGPFPGAVISQPALPGTFKRIPDFLWPTKVSGRFRPVLLEIERPSKPWFRGDGQAHAKLTEAINQVAEWRTWLDSGANQLLLYELYGISSWIRAYHKVEPIYGLIYGRRSEFGADPTQSRHRESIRPGWLHWRTYDRLSPDAGARHWVTVKVIEGRWTVVAVPPTFDLRRGWNDSLQGLSGLETAICANALISDDRKEYLVDRLSAVDLKPAAPPNLWEVVIRDLEEPDDLEPLDWDRDDSGDDGGW